MLEIEQKYSGADHAALHAALAALGASAAEVHVEADHYFNAPDRDFARTGEAFRLRRIGAVNLLTYKGPKQAAAVKVRAELEVPLLPGDDAAAEYIDLLQRLGYRPVAIVRKWRSSCTLHRAGFDVQVCLDEVDELGAFAEVEVLCEQEQAARAAEVLTRLAEQLGLRQVEPRSYLTQLLAARAASAARTPRVVASVAELRAALAEAARQRQTVGLVPTMGALHEGHLSLIRVARARNDLVVASIFVNPTQFAPHEDFNRYPRPFADDVRLCGEAGVDLIFAPDRATLYPPEYRTYVEVTGLQDVLEGAARPGHFRGVATIVLKLFNLVRPDRAYFGQKDAQQVRIIQQMVRDLDVPVEVIVCPTVRESDGLALSSRNRYLDADQRQQAPVLSRAMEAARRLYEAGERDPATLRRVMADLIATAPAAVLDYAVAVDPVTFESPARLTEAALLAVAVRFGDTRLIDNLPLSVRAAR